MKKILALLLVWVVLRPREVWAAELTIKILDPTWGPQALVNGELLLDMGGPCGSDNYCLSHQQYEIGLPRFRGYGVNPDSIKYILITNWHGDHLNEDKVMELANARSSGAEKLWLGAGIDVFNRMGQKLVSTGKPNLINLKKFDPYETYEVGPYKITAFTASHGNPPPWPTEHGFMVYGVEYMGKKIWLSQDSGPYSAETEAQIKAKMGKLDYIVEENTFTKWRGGAADPYQGGFNDYIIHMNNCELNKRYDNWKANGLITDATPIKYIHIASWFNELPGIGFSRMDCPEMKYGQLGIPGQESRYEIVPTVVPTLIPTATMAPARPNPGDANGDKRVDQADFNIWKSERFEANGNVKEGVANPKADFDNNGKVDNLDYEMWLAEYKKR